MTTVSPILIGCVIESWIPPMRLASGFCAANPRMIPASPAEASSESPKFRTSVNCIRAAPEPTTTITPVDICRSRVS